MYIVFHQHNKYSIKTASTSCSKKVDFMHIPIVPKPPRPLHTFDENAWNQLYNHYISIIVQYVCDELSAIHVDGHEVSINHQKISTYIRRLLYRTSSNTSKRTYFLK